MSVKTETIPNRTELSGSQRALLEERLRRARDLAARNSETRSSIPRRPAGGDVPLSFAQERLWFIDQLEPGTAVYNVCQAVRLQGLLDSIALERTLNEIVRRHEVLRTNFVAHDGHPIQVIHPDRELTLAFVDLSGWQDGTGEEELQRRLKEEARRPFDLAHDLMIRALLIRTSAVEHTLMLTMHHIVSDGWSIGILFRELATLYPAFRRGQPAAAPELPIQYADYVFWEREAMQGPAVEKPLDFWRRQLKSPLPVLELPVDHPRSVAPMSRGAARTIQLPRPLTQALKALGQQEGATLFMTLLATFQTLLYRWTGQEDIVVGSVVAGRRKVELEKLIGFFVNTLVFRGDLGGSPTFRELLGRTRDTAVAALAHQDLPFERLVKELRPDRSLSRHPLFQVMFVLQNAPMAPTNLPELRLEPLDVDTGTAKFDLTLSMIETPEGLRAALEYNADLFEPATIGRMLGALHTLLVSITADPDQPIARLALLTPAERHQLLSGWNQTATDYPRNETVVRLFAQQAARAPHAVAVRYESSRLTYLDLDARSNQLARWLRCHGVNRERLVAVSLERSPELIVALVAILKAGGAYVSLDPGYPPERLGFMLRDTGARVLLTQKRLRPRVDAFVRQAVADPAGASDAASPEILCLDSQWDEVATESDAPVGAEILAESLAYVSYTSGSTGTPKGVAVPHRGIVRLVQKTDFARFGPDDVFLQFAPIAFDASTLEIWGALLNGARLEVYPPGPSSLADLGGFIERNGVTTAWLTAGLFHQMIEEQIDRLQNVRQLLAGGDVLSPAHVARALELLPRTQLINGYGPTENTTFTCCHRITAPPLPGRSVPIGRPIANTQVYILDHNLQPVPVGVPGELYAGGDGLARGYWNRPELTREKFISHPFSRDPEARLYKTGDRARWLPDGSIEFLGRIDRQVKIRGFRVEPAEVESVLAAHPGVKECAVVVRDDGAGEKRLVAYLVAKETPAPATDVWRVHLEEKLPDYLVPAAFITRDALPLTPNGKLDVAALPVSDGARPDLQGHYVVPRDDIERQLVTIWENVLNVRPVGIHDQFFALGGHSLLAVRMTAQLEKTFGKKLPVAAIFQHRTVDQLARLLRDPEPRYAPATSVVEIHGQGTRPRLYLVHGVGGGMFWGYANLARHLGPDQPLYAFKSRGLDGLPEWPTIEDMAATYVADLRAHQPRGPYLIGGYCFGGIVAYEMARQLRARGEEVALLALINGSPPNTRYQKDWNRWSPRWQCRFLANFGYWVSCFLFRWTWRERREFVRWKLRLLRKRTNEAVGHPHAEVALGDIDQIVDLAAYSEERRALWGAHVRALMNYQPGPYPGRVTLFRTRGHPLLCSFDPRYGWGELARGGVEVKIVRGGHGNVLAEPFVTGVAEALRSCLGAAAARPGGEEPS
ncbi:MAG TPA: amino acid adenylation domain-containing protein [Opitutaceae bacterium]|nr:amino acid adenylation domain-containing protein [Opitutaceae bacterium]